MQLYAKIILKISHKDIDKIFDYAVPENMEGLICRGMRVLVPFGARNTATEGYVIEISNNTDIEYNRLKYIIECMDPFPVFSDTAIELAFFMKEKYYTTLSSCFQTIMPAGIKSKTYWFVILNEVEKESDILKHKEKDIIDFIKNSTLEYVPQDIIEKEFGKNIYSVLKSLSEKNIIKFVQKVNKNSFINNVKYIVLSENLELIKAEKEKLSKSERGKNQLLVIRLLENSDKPFTSKQICEVLEIDRYSVNALIKKGVLKVNEVEEKRNVFDAKDFKKTSPFVPTAQQKSAIDFIIQKLDTKEKRPILIHGVTGSGKTEIYLQVIDDVIKKGKQAIVLVPEISLTPQMVMRFIGRFGEKVSVTHSHMNFGERFDQWKKAKFNEISIMIGPRSAIFTPFNNIGAIIIDEEHEDSYKSEVSPKYDAREIGKKLSEITGALLVLGSATPSLESYYKTQNNQFDLITLDKRANNSFLPDVYIKDMRTELAQGNRMIFSKELYNSIKQNLDDKLQTMLFLNRRGFSTFVSCRQCGNVLTCDNCNVSYTYHSDTKELVCHYCGKKIKKPQVCPACGSKYIKYFGTGTQKIEAEIRNLFPEARILRMDSDTTSKKNSLEAILNKFSKGEADILIGTQMIAKGHDFPKVSLVGIVAADISINMGDYRSNEITFQLLTQAAGRAGRGNIKGKVYIQTYNPENYSIVYAANQDYIGFYNDEISVRKMMEYPPFSHICTIMLYGKNEQNVINEIYKLHEILKYFNKKNDFTILGPAPGIISKIKNEYRWKVIIKYADEERLRKYSVYCVEKYNKKFALKDIFVNMTIDPASIV